MQKQKAHIEALTDETLFRVQEAKGSVLIIYSLPEAKKIGLRAVMDPPHLLLEAIVLAMLKEKALAQLFLAAVEIWEEETAIQK